MSSKSRHLVLLTSALLLTQALGGAGCVGGNAADDPFACERCDAASDGGVGLVDGTPAAVGLLWLLNDETTTLGVLDDEVPLDRRTAENLIAHRDGPDQIFGTADDDLYDDVAEVDGVDFVGPAALTALLEYAQAEGWVPSGDDLLGVYDGVSFTVREATDVLGVINLESEATLDEEVGLDHRAVESILEARPISSILLLSELYYVGGTALERLKAFATGDELLGGSELGVISDLDKTVIPPSPLDALPEAAYPGVADLYTALELGGGGAAGDMYYVTARAPEDTTEIPAWLEDHGLPAGPISTGVADAFWLAESEKVADISAILEAHPNQRFILFGDNNHVDHRVYATILDRFPEHIAAALIHRVRDMDESTIAPEIMLYDDYAHAAALLLSRRLIDETTARNVMVRAREQGLEITDEEIEQLLTDHRPQ